MAQNGPKTGHDVTRYDHNEKSTRILVFSLHSRDVADYSSREVSEMHLILACVTEG